MDLLETHFDKCVHLFKYGSVDSNRAAATATYCYPSISMEGSESIQFSCHLDIREALRFLAGAPWILHPSQPCKTAILTDSRSAIHLLGNPNEAGLLACTVANTCGDLEGTRRTLVFQWVTPHADVHANETAEFLGSADHNVDRPIIFLRPLAEAKWLIKAIVNLHHFNKRIARRHGPQTIFHLHLPPPGSWIRQRLCTRTPLSSQEFVRFRRVRSPNGTFINAVGDVNQLLWGSLGAPTSAKKLYLLRGNQEGHIFLLKISISSFLREMLDPGHYVDGCE